MTYYPATPTHLEAITKLGLPAPAADFRYYINPNGTADWVIEWTSATDELVGSSRWSDNGPEYRTSLQQEEDEGAGLVDLTARIGEIFTRENLAEDAYVEVTIDAGLLARTIADRILAA